MADEDEEVTILEKTGKELFRELLRFYPVADVEDYYKPVPGQGSPWKDDDMKMDLQLLWAHRKEAGAPDPIALEEVPEPELPQAFSAAPAMAALTLSRPLMAAPQPGVPQAGMVASLQHLRALAAQRQALAAGGLVRPVSPMAPRPLMAGALRPLIPGQAMPPGAAAASSPVTELRLIALFVAKWKLDATRTKMMLAKMTPPRRRFVIQNFKTTAAGPAAMLALEAYIAQCERTGWAGAATAGYASTAPRPLATPGSMALANGSMAHAAAVAAAAKRPLSAVASPYMDPNKRPRMAVPSPSGQAAAAQAVQARLAAMRAASGVTRFGGGAAPAHPTSMAAAAAMRAGSARPPSVRPVYPMGLARPASAAYPGGLARPASVGALSRPPTPRPSGLRPAFMR